MPAENETRLAATTIKAIKATYLCPGDLQLRWSGSPARRRQGVPFHQSCLPCTANFQAFL